MSFTTFSKFRTALQRMDINIVDLVHATVAIYNDGWTVESLTAVFMDKNEFPIDRYFKCKICSSHGVSDHASKWSWGMRLGRHKAGTPFDAPLSEIELANKRDEEECIPDFNDICWGCQQSKKERPGLLGLDSKARWT